jgi:hypothetical protein
MSPLSEGFGFVSGLAGSETTTVNEVAAHMGTDSRFARMLLLRAHMDGLVNPDAGFTCWIRAETPDEPPV